MNLRSLRSSLVVKFSLLISLPILLVSLALSNSFMRHNLRQIETTMLERGKSIARGLSRSSEYGLLIGSEEILNGVVSKYTNEEDMLYISVRDAAGEILAGYGEVADNLSNGTPPSGNASANEQEGNLSCHITETSSLYDVVCDVVTIRERRSREDIGILGSDILPGKGSQKLEKIGTVQIGVSKAGMIESMNEAKRSAFWLTTLAIGLAILATIVIVRLMLRPIKRLAIATGKASRGDFDYKVEVKSNDEIGVLAGAFNGMMSDLKNSSEALHYRSEIERLIASISTNFINLASDEVDDGISSTLQRIGEFVDVDLSYVFLLSDDAKTVEQVYKWSSEGTQSQIQDLKGSPVDKFPWWTERLNRLDSVHVSRASDLPPESDLREFILSQSIQSFVIVPMIYAGNIVGILGLSSIRAERTWIEEDIMLLKMIGEIFVNALERKRAEEALQRQLAVEERMTRELKKEVNERKRTEEELASSNAELQQFAYIASHDLQEPLRMVASYLQLLERRYKGKLDDDADDFINFAVDGASRMQRLINDLLAYSRVSTRGKEFEFADCEAVLKHTLTNLQIAIKEIDAVVTHDPLPTVTGDDVQLGQLLQNLISNAIKFRNEKPPRVHISAELKGNEWVFSVRDNGIGIDPEYADRIFAIFQRLHGAGKYPGTGIGLAVCKRIVERHGGRIWVESQPGNGSTFYFTIAVGGAK